MLIALQDGNIHLAAALFKEVEFMSKSELSELAGFFEQGKSATASEEFRLVLKRRKTGRPSEGVVSRIQAYENGALVASQISQLLASGKKKNVMHAIGLIIKSWEGDDTPSQYTLKRDYAYFDKVRKLNPSFVMSVFPPLSKAAKKSK